MRKAAPDRTLHEWHRYIKRARRLDKWRKSNWKGKLGWILFSLYSGLTLRSLRSWWKEAAACSDEYGALVEEWTGQPREKQLRQMASLALRHGIAPQDYYRFKLYRPERLRRAERFVFGQPKIELNRFLEGLAHPQSGSTVLDLKDKRSWFAWAKKHGVPTACALASFDEGKVTPMEWDGQAESLPEIDLFSIWTNQARGRGAQCWVYEEGRYVDVQNPSLRFTASELLQYLAQRSAEHPVVLQERLRNHSNLRGYTSGALATCRLVTGRFPKGDPRPLMATQKMPVGNSAVDNIAAGGSISAPVTLADGGLGPAVSGMPSVCGDSIYVHPDTGYPFTESPFPFWEAMLELVLDVHRKLPGVPFVGWDVTVAEEGPVVLEPNFRWGAIDVSCGVASRDTTYEVMYDSWMQYLGASN